jgi:hypothetical protein
MKLRSGARWYLGLLLALAGAAAVRPAAAGYAVARTSVVRTAPRPPPVARGPAVVNRSVTVSTYNPAGVAVGVAAATAVTALAVGAVVNSLPPSCATIVTAGATYHHCGNDWYRPQYSGTNVIYVVVPSP